MAKISVIAPVYNAEKYLDRFINSVLSQSLDDIELILVDDQSTDKSFDICNHFAELDERIQVFQCPVNSGPMIARQIGIDNATGDYLNFSDSDDELPLNALEKLYINALDNSSDIVSGSANYIKNDGTVEIWRSILKYGNDRKGLLLSLLSYNYKHNLLAKIIKRSLFFCESLYNIEGMKYFEDYVLFYQLAMRCERTSVIDDVVYLYYQNGGSSTQRAMDARRLEDSYIAYSFVYSLLKDNPELSNKFTSYLQYSIKNQYLLGYNKKGLAKKLIKKYGFDGMFTLRGIFGANNFLNSMKLVFGFSVMGRMWYVIKNNLRSSRNTTV